jgi:uncharacterized protein
VRLFGPGGMYPAGDSLDRHVPPATLMALKALLPRYQLPEERVLRMKLWMVPMLLSVLEVQRAGYDAAYGAEMFLGAYARAHDMPLIEIEGMDAQAKMLADFPEPLMQEVLADGLADLSTGKAGKNLVETIDSWRKSDRGAVERTIKAMKTSKRRSEREFGLRMLDQRNVGMADRAEQLVRDGGTTFFAVGSMHLFGDTGLVTLLRKRGYEVAERR